MRGNHFRLWRCTPFSLLLLSFTLTTTLPCFCFHTDSIRSVMILVLLLGDFHTFPPFLVYISFSYLFSPCFSGTHPPAPILFWLPAFTSLSSSRSVGEFATAGTALPHPGAGAHSKFSHWAQPLANTFLPTLSVW